jgi:hypothetical protein
MLPKDWLNNFLLSRQIQSTDNRPLYRYRMNDDEFVSLKSALSTTALFGIDNIHKTAGWNAAFVIYASEWWRREYDGSSWSWDKLFASFNADVKVLSINRRNVLVETGLRYWKREVRKINDSYRYLGTIAIEGGLPLNQITSKSNDWLGRVFRQVIPKYSRLQHTGVNAENLVDECDYIIPRTYQNEQVFAILGDMVKTVVEFKQKYALQDCNDPIGVLDQKSPTWRENFPLPIGTEVGQTLLSDMVLIAAKVSDQKPNQPFRGVRKLGADGVLQLHFELAGFVPIERLNLVEPIPSRLDVELVSSDGTVKSLGVALKTTYQGKPSLQIQRCASIIKGDQAANGYWLRLRHLSMFIYNDAIADCEELDTEAPWTFCQQNDDWILEGVASISARANLVRILYPSQLRCQESESVVVLQTSSHNRFIEASGIIQFSNHDGANFVIKTGQDVSADRFYLQGKLLEFISRPMPVYLGLPTLVCVNNENERRTEISASKLVARLANTRNPWSPASDIHHGVIEIRYQDSQGNVRFRKKCAILPEDFLARFKPSPKSLDGRICLDNLGSAKVICESAIRYTINSEINAVCVDLYADSAPPAYVDLSLSWPRQPEMLTVTLPFPARGGQIINSEGIKQSSRQPLFLDQLHGFRLRLFNEVPNKNRHLQIELRLKDNVLSDARDLYFRDDVRFKGAVIEIALIDYQEWFQSFLAISRNLDSNVSFAVYENGTELLKTEVFRYQFMLQRDLVSGSVELDSIDHASLGHDQISGIELKAMRLAQPEQAHITLESQRSEEALTGRWFFYPEKRDLGSWLIYPTESSSVSLRPILWHIGEQADDSELFINGVTTLHRAVTLGNDYRQESIRNVLKIMCSDHEHSGWNYLRNLCKHCMHLPMASFDVWTISVTSTEVLANLVFQMDEHFTKKLGEELPVFWELIPVQDWIAALRSLQNYLGKTIDDPEDTQLIIESRIKRITNLNQSMVLISRLLKQEFFNTPDQELNAMKGIPFDVVKNIIRDSQQELDRRQAESQWPEMLKPELMARWLQLDKSAQRWLTLNSITDHHRAVTILPVLLAIYCSTHSAPDNWLGDSVSIFKINRLKAFDEDWFNATFSILLAYLSQNPAT